MGSRLRRCCLPLWKAAELRGRRLGTVYQMAVLVRPSQPWSGLAQCDGPVHLQAWLSPRLQLLGTGSGSRDSVLVGTYMGTVPSSCLVASRPPGGGTGMGQSVWGRWVR